PLLAGGYPLPVRWGSHRLFTFRPRDGPVGKPSLVPGAGVALDFLRGLVAGPSHDLRLRTAVVGEPRCPRFPKAVRRAMSKPRLTTGAGEPVAEALGRVGVAELRGDEQHLAGGNVRQRGREGREDRERQVRPGLLLRELQAPALDV